MGHTGVGVGGVCHALVGWGHVGMGWGGSCRGGWGGSCRGWVVPCWGGVEWVM